MVITFLGSGRISGTKVDRVSDSLGSDADGTNTGITLIATSGTITLGSGSNGSSIGTCGDNAQGVPYVGLVCKSGSLVAGCKITNVKMDLYRHHQTGSTSAPTTALQARIIRGSDDGVQETVTSSTTFANLPTSSPSSPNVTFTFSGNYEIQVGDRIVLYYNWSNAEWYAKMDRKSGSGFVDQYVYQQSGSWDSGSSGLQPHMEITHTTNSNIKLGTGAYSFNGSSSKVVCGSASDWTFLNDKSSDWTIAWWHKNTEGTISSNGQMLFTTADNGGTADGFYCDLRSGNGLRAGFQGSNGSAGGNASWSGAVPTDATVWTHFALVCDISESKVALYKNGTLVSNESVSWSAGYDSDFALNIGNRMGVQFLECDLDDIGIYKRVLTTTEISDLVNLQPDSSTTTTPSSWFTSPNTDDNTTTKNANNRVGNKIEAGNDLVGKRVTEVSFNIYVQSSYSGSNTASFKLWNSSGTERHNFGTFNISSLGTSATKVTQNTAMGSGVTVTANDFIGIENNNTDSDIKMKQNYNTGGESTSIPNASRSSWNGSAWSTDPDADAHMEAKYYGTSPAGALVSSLSDKSGLKAYYSMNATSLTDASPTETTMFSTGTGWTGDTSTWAYNSTISGIGCDTSTVGEAVVKSLGTQLSKSGKWVARFKLTRNSGDAGDGIMLNFGSASASTSTLARMQNDDYPYGIHVYIANSGDLYFASHNTSFGWDGSSNGSGKSLSTGSSVYVEVQHHSATSSTVKFHDNSDYSDTPTSQTRTFSGQTLDYDDIGLGTKWSNNNKNVDLEDFEVWVGVDKLSGCKNDHSSTSELDAYTNLVENSIFKQTDDTPTYWWKQSDNTWKIDGTTGAPKGIDGLYAWFDANDSSTITKDSSNKVSKWTDKSGNSLGSNLDLLQSSSSLQPTWTSGDKNGLTTLNFSGSYMKTDTSVSIPSESQPITYFFVAKTGSSGERIIFDGSYGSSADYEDWRQNIGKNGSNNWFVDGGATSTGASNTTWYYATAIFNGSSGQLNLNGTTISSTLTTGTRKLRFGTMGTWSDGTSSQRWEGTIAEFIVYNRLLTSAEILEVETYLKDKWGL